MDRKTKGRIGETAVHSYFAERGYDVYTPLFDNCEVDCVVIKGGVVQTVSIKYTSMESPSGGYVVKLYTTYRDSDGGSKTKHFDNNRVDLLAVYVSSLKDVVVLDAKKLKSKSQHTIPGR